ncbi:hypothetical protein C7M84_019915 [Penaeus vannamei]|uniref:Uncharacterized protein n=1 Tax=Penaeus vannamei TaxID=6689 RepID=A0A423SDG7_PENVA|nr:hypothetical protein C7M84_019915 [Penaeus vannamei]
MASDRTHGARQNARLLPLSPGSHELYHSPRPSFLPLGLCSPPFALFPFLSLLSPFFYPLPFSSSSFSFPLSSLSFFSLHPHFLSSPFILLSPSHPSSIFSLPFLSPFFPSPSPLFLLTSPFSFLPLSLSPLPLSFPFFLLVRSLSPFPLSLPISPFFSSFSPFPSSSHFPLSSPLSPFPSLLPFFPLSSSLSPTPLSFLFPFFSSFSLSPLLPFFPLSSPLFSSSSPPPPFPLPLASRVLILVYSRRQPPILREEVEAAVEPSKKGKSAGTDNISAELVQAGGQDMVSALLTVCNKTRRTGEWPTPQTPVSGPRPPQERQSTAEPKLLHAEHLKNKRVSELGATRQSRSCFRMLRERFLQRQQDDHEAYSIIANLVRVIATRAVLQTASMA